MDSTFDELSNRFTARSLMNSAMDWWESPNQGNQGSAAVRKAAVTLATQSIISRNEATAAVATGPPGMQKPPI